MRKVWILICILALLFLTGCSKEPGNISITDYEWLFSNYMCSDNGTYYCTLPASKNRPNSVPAEVTLSPATETALSLLNTELGYEILLIDQNTGEQRIYTYGLTLSETSIEKTVYSVTISGEAEAAGQAVVSREEGNSAMLLFVTTNGIFTFFSP